MVNRLKTVLSYENRVLLILMVVGGVAAIDILGFNFLAPFIATDLHLDNSEIGFIGGAGLLTWSLGAISSALWSDRIERRRIFLVISLLGFALLSTATAFAKSFLMLLAARLLVGLSEGPVVPMSSTIMHGESSLHRRGLNIGIVQNLGSQLLGGIAGPLILVAIATQIGWRNAFLIAAAPALVMAAIVRLRIREPTREIRSVPHTPVWQSIKRIFAARNIRLCFLIGTCSIGWLATTTIFLPLRIIRDLHFAPSVMSVIMACVGAGGAVGSILVTALSDRYGRRPMLVGFALTGILIPICMLFAPSSVALIGVTVFVGSFFTGIMPLFIAIIPMESVDTKQGASALSIVMGGAQIVGSLLGPLLGGVLADRFSLAAPFWLSLGLAFGAASIGLFLTETAPAKRSRLLPITPSRRQASLQKTQ